MEKKKPFGETRLSQGARFCLASERTWCVIMTQAASKVRLWIDVIQNIFHLVPST